MQQTAIKPLLNINFNKMEMIMITKWSDYGYA